MSRRSQILIAAAFSAAGRYSMIWLAAAGLGVVFGNDWKLFVWFAVAIFVEWAFTNGAFKRLFNRQRPDTSEIAHLIPTWLHPPRTSSFPSGHSSSSSFAAVIWWAINPIAGAIATAVALGMGASRIIIKAHHPSDVLAGFIWGALLAAGAIAIYQNYLV